MAEVQYVSNERFEGYQKHVNQRFDDVSLRIKYELDNRLDNLRREVTWNAKRRTLFTMTYLAAGGFVAAVIVLFAFILLAI